MLPALAGRSLFLVVTHLLVFLIPLVYVVSAGPSPAPDPYPAVISLPSRARPVTRHTPVSVAAPLATANVEHDLLPFVLVSTIDGALHAIDRDNGKVRWTLREGVEPLVGGGVKGKGGEEDYIVEPSGGGLYVFEQEDEQPQVRKLPLTVDQLIELSPFTFPHSPSRIFTGSKQSSLITIDLRNGQQLNCFSSLASNGSVQDCVCEDERLLDDMDSRARSNRDILFVGRTDYRLTIHTPPGADVDLGGLTIGERKNQGGVQEIVYSTYTPNSFDRPLADLWSKMGHSELVEEDGQLVKRMRVELGHDNIAIGVEQGSGYKWSAPLGAAGIAVYDILLPLTPTHANPILVPQPPPHLASLFPRSDKPLPPHLDFLNKQPSTYIGQIHRLAPELHSTKPLYYALSSSRYPLINLAPPPRPGSLANGSFPLSEELPERDQLLPYLLDPPAESTTAEDSVATQDEKAVSRLEPARSPRGWVFWMNVVMAAVILAGSVVMGLSWRNRTRISVLVPEVTEKTPLVDRESKKSVKFVNVPDESAEIDGDKVATTDPPPSTEMPAKKKSTRRRVRGKKKSKQANGNDRDSPDGNVDDEDDDDGMEDDKGSVAASPKGKSDKPLPDLPREMSAVDLTQPTQDPDGEDKERLTISDTVIGFGSHGTVVLKGTWGSRAVAVKRLLSDFTRLASQEVKLLQASDDHPNVIRYYCQERRDNFLYIALDLCQASLADLIDSPDKHIPLASVLDRKKALREVTGGLRHLHDMKIIHRDIKPQNVLVSQLKDGSLRMLMSDFGLARRLEQDQSSFAPTANNLAGSLGWRAPECIRGHVRLHDGSFDGRDPAYSSSSSSTSSITELAEDDNSTPTKAGRKHARLTKAVDLFALGCLYFWVLMSGQHPYGEVYDRESNIVRGDAVNMDSLDILGEEGVEAKALIGAMLSADPEDRPETGDCLTHPFFWTPAKRLAFLCDASDRFEILNLDPPEPPIVALESRAFDVVGKDWFSRADKVFTSNLGKYRKYKGGSVRDLLRAMRNKKHHYQDLEPSAQRHFGSLPAGFLNYFTSRYPRLFLHVYGVIKDSRLRHESMFEGYFAEAGT